MVGLDAAGKTTILYKLKLGEIVTTIPTIGMDITVSVHYSYPKEAEYFNCFEKWLLFPPVIWGDK